MENCMTVLFCFHFNEKNNGGVKSLLDMLKVLSEKGVLIIAAFPFKDGSAIEYLREQGVKVLYVPYTRWDYKLNTSTKSKFKSFTWGRIKQIKTYIEALKFKKILKEEKIDIVYTNTNTIFFGAMLNAIYKIPHFWHVREFGDLDHGNGYILGFTTFKKFVERYTTKMIVISKVLKNYYECKGIPSEKMITIYDDVSNEYQLDFSYEKFRSNYLNILIAGILQEGKGQIDVLKAFNELCKVGVEANLYIAGKGDESYTQKLKKFVVDNHLNKKVHFLGFVEDMNALRKKMHIAVVASKSEAFGRVTIEAMLGGLVVVATDAGANSELVDNGRTGYLYPSGDYHKLFDCIYRIQENRENMYETAVRAQKYALQYTNGNCGIRIYQEMLKEI